MELDLLMWLRSTSTTMNVVKYPRRKSIAVVAAISFLSLTGFGPCAKTGAPSTGKEMPHGPPQKKMTEAEARQSVADAVAEYKKGPNRDCAKVTKLLVQGLPDTIQSQPEEDAFYDLADCAHTQHRYMLMKEATVRILSHNPKFAHPALLPQAEVGMGNYDKAQKDLDILLPANPKDAELLYVKTQITCNQMKWGDCQKGMGDSIRTAKSYGMPPATEKMLEANADVEIADSQMHLGQVAQAQAMLDTAVKLGADPKWTDSIKKEMVEAKTAKVVIDEFHQHEIPLGVYHLYGKAKMAGVPAQVWIYNIGTADRQFRVEGEIVGVSERFKTNVTVLKGGNEAVQIIPPLKAGFNVSAQRSDTPSQMQLKIVELDPKGEKTIRDVSFEIKVLPRDSLLLATRVDEDATKPVDGYIGAWVTPNAKAVDEFLTAAKKRAPKATFAGPQTATLPQVEAIFDELKDRGVSYVMDPEAASEMGFAQRTRLPSDVLASKNAQCLEGAILFATLMEAIGLEPIIVRIPGHAFAGWHSAKDGIPDGTPLFVETTMVHSASYDDAVSYAKTEVEKQNQQKNFAQGIARFIEVKQLRAAGITPQPWE